MKLSDFKKDLKAVGVDYSRLEELNHNLLYHIRNSDSAYEVVEGGLFAWNWSKEGYAYWRKKRNALYKLHHIAKEGSICDYPILKSGNNWVIGCQTITHKRRLKLFKLLADDLGYELTEE